MTLKPPEPLFDNIKHFNQLINLPTQLLFPDDYQHAHNFLYAYRGSEATFNAYRREIERFLHWSWIVAKKSINQLHYKEIESFIEFCQQPPQSWIGHKQIARFLEKNGQRVINPDWRPYVITTPKAQALQSKRNKYQLSQQGIQAIFSILNSFYNFLLQEEYIGANPVSQIRQKSKFLRKQQGSNIIRRLSELQWHYVIETAERLAHQDPLKHERTLFIMNALYAMYLRISELVANSRWQPQMGHFYRDQDNNWWFETVGKGNKHRTIAVSNAMLAALKRYRQHLGLSPLPTPGETTPLISKLRSNGAVTSTRFIRMLVQTCFDVSFERMVADNLADEASELRAATVHWLRHTGISEDVKHRPREHVRDDAGHSSSAITDKYIDIELRSRHDSSKQKKIKPED